MSEKEERAARFTAWLLKHSDRYVLKEVYDLSGIYSELYNKSTGECIKFSNSEEFSTLLEGIIGENFLLDNQERFTLNCEYDNDAGKVYIQVTNERDGKSTVLDGADIFRQVYEWIEKERKNFD